MALRAPQPTINLAYIKPKDIHREKQQNDRPQKGCDYAHQDDQR